MSVDIDAVLARELTNEQREAAIDSSSEILTIACAGSGKSRTLAFRIARMIAQGTAPDSIVAFTFTRKAADSIKVRVAAALEAIGLSPTIAGAMYVGTIDAFCKQLLGAMDATYRQFDLLDPNGLKLFLMSRQYDLPLQALRPTERYFAKINAVAAAWADANAEMIDFNAIQVADSSLGDVLLGLRDLLIRDQFMDFSLCVRLTVEALQRGEEGVTRALSNFKHLMVDEYQDVNFSQESLIRELHRRSNTLFVVGDDDQAIYSWRGADVNNILTFSQRYEGCAQHTLPRNFRSTPAIVSAADQFAQAVLGARRLPKNPSAEVTAEPQELRKLFFADQRDEAEWIASRIASFHGTEYGLGDKTRTLRWADFAILMRSTGKVFSGEPRHLAFTQALERHNIPYTLSNGGSALDRPQVAVLRDGFELLRDKSPDRTTVDAFWRTVVLPIYPNADFNALTAVMAQWGRLVHGATTGPRRRVFPQQLVYDLLGAFNISSTIFDDGQMRDLGVFSRIMKDVESVFVSVDSQSRFRQILNFLQNIANDGYTTGKDESVRRPDVVTISTIHGVKGLEFPCVFVSDVEALRFPGNRRGYSGWIPAALLQVAIAAGRYQKTVEEEARLFYTAVTRAERYLSVTGSAIVPGTDATKRPSNFTAQLQHPSIIEVADGLPQGMRVGNNTNFVEDSVVPTSFSEIKLYLNCPRAFKYSKVFGFNPPINEQFGFGTTLHTSIEKVHEVFSDRAPTVFDAEAVAKSMFHMKHVSPSKDPINKPGPYERLEAAATDAVGRYVSGFADDFSKRRRIELAFEVPLKQAIITGAIDLLIVEEDNQIVGVEVLDPDDSAELLALEATDSDEHTSTTTTQAEVVDFKASRSIKNGVPNAKLNWTDLSMQVQLYALGATDVLGHAACTGQVHMLGDGVRLEIPVDRPAVDAAVANVEWAVDRIISEDFPMRPEPGKCDACDFKLLCPKLAERFATDTLPPEIHLPSHSLGADRVMARAFSKFSG